MNWKFKSLEDAPVEITVTFPPPDPEAGRRTGTRRAWEDLIEVTGECIAQAEQFAIEPPGGIEPQDPYTVAWAEGFSEVYKKIREQAQAELAALGEE